MAALVPDKKASSFKENKKILRKDQSNLAFNPEIVLPPREHEAPLKKTALTTALLGKPKTPDENNQALAP